MMKNKTVIKKKKRNASGLSQPDFVQEGESYEIKIKGSLDEDQPDLHGLPAKIRDLNLILISVRKPDPKISRRHGGAST